MQTVAPFFLISINLETMKINLEREYQYAKVEVS